MSFKTFFMALSLAVLEGVAIGFNPDYKVLGSTYPWIARKVLTDNSPQLKSSLQAVLYEVKLQFFVVPFISGRVFDLFYICSYYCVYTSSYHDSDT